MKFRTTLLLCVVLLIAGILAATVGGLAITLRRAAWSGIEEDLTRSRADFEEHLALRRSLYRAECRVVAEEPRLKAVVATEDVSRETVISVAFEIHKAIRSDLFLLTDGEGRLLADVADPKAAGDSMRSQPLVAGALADGDSTGILTHAGRAYQAAGHRLSFGETTVGVLVIGYRIDDGLAAVLQRQTGSDIVIELEGKIIASSTITGGTLPESPALSAALDSVPTGSAEPVEIRIDGARYLAIAEGLVGAGSGVRLRCLALLSLDRALRPARSAAQILYGISVVALLAGALLALVLSRRLSRPLDRLVAFIDGVASGKLDERATIEGPIELRTLGAAMNHMVEELGESRLQMAAKDRLTREMEIGKSIQTSILPAGFDVDGLEISARMIPASEVGGDYYDVLAVPGGGWIGIGDVAGHGLPAGLIMLMVQSTVAALCRECPDAAPREIVRVVNEVLYENIRHRLRKDEHVTMSILRYFRDGRFLFAGAHEDIIICRKSSGVCEMVLTPGTWVGAKRDVAAVTVDSRMALDDGDVMILYTDGVTEAMSREKEAFGIERICAVTEREMGNPVEQIRDAIFSAVEAWSDAPLEDDRSVVALRYRSPTGSAGSRPVEATALVEVPRPEDR